MASMPSDPAAQVCESDPTSVAPGTPKRCMCVGCETPLPGLENHSPNRRAAERRNAWSSALRSSACSRLWSTYCTLTSVRARSRPIASSSSMTSVPVASWVRVWSMRSAISSPATGSPETRCSSINFLVTVRAAIWMPSRSRRNPRSAVAVAYPRQGCGTVARPGIRPPMRNRWNSRVLPGVRSRRAIPGGGIHDHVGARRRGEEAPRPAHVTACVEAAMNGV